jgi:hypothetical protein
MGEPVYIWMQATIVQLRWFIIPLGFRGHNCYTDKMAGLKVGTNGELRHHLSPLLKIVASPFASSTEQKRHESSHIRHKSKQTNKTFERSPGG